MACMALEPAKSEPMAAVKSTKYCRTVTCMSFGGDGKMVGGARSTLCDWSKSDKYRFRLAESALEGCIRHFDSRPRAEMLRARVRALATAARDPPAAPTARHKRKKNLFVTVGLPLVLFVVGGYVGLTQFMGGKYEARDHAIKSQSTRAFDLDEEHKRMTQKLLLDDFELKPVPKPKE